MSLGLTLKRLVARVLGGGGTRPAARDRPPAEPVARPEPAPAARITPRPEVLTGAFEAGFVGEAGERRFAVRVVRLGTVHLPSGRVVVADPFTVWDDAPPLDLAIAPGRYPVDLAIADTGSSGHRVALARLQLSDAAPVRWSMAVTADQDASTLTGAELFGYGVDAGTGAFMDADSLAWRGAQTPDDFEALSDDWLTRGETEGAALGVPYLFAMVGAVGPGEVAMFSSGWGDGFYASWVGYDVDDNPVAVVTDFTVIAAVDGD